MEFLPILQDFVPYRGRCPASTEITINNFMDYSRAREPLTILMPLGDWFNIFLSD